jgi:GNAT superfamily N-acetyltransferase
MIKIAAYSSAFQSAVINVILPIQREEFGLGVTVDDQPDLLEIPGFYQSGSGGFWIALDGPNVVGTIALRDIGNRQGALRKMFVKASHRGPEFGVSRLLLDHLVTTSVANGIAEVLLGTTERFHAAHRFYERNGFKRIAVIDLPATFPRMAVDTRFYRRYLQLGA